jgi:membrane associated rhomboid family serine protease
MTTFISDIEKFFKQKSVLSYLIIINIIFFLFRKIVSQFFFLFNFQSEALVGVFELPSSFIQLFYHPWTLVTYMFTHWDLWHIALNLLWLYWFGKIFILFFGSRQLGGLYILGGLAGGLLFIVSYNIFPYFRMFEDNSYLMGASASVMAVVFATAFYNKNYEIRLIFLGSVKLIYIAVFFLILDFVSIEIDNPGGHIAHIGGAGMGIWFAKSYLKGKDLTVDINYIIDGVVNIFAKKKRRPEIKCVYRRSTETENNNKRKSNRNKEIDRILDKLKKSGYNSLSEREKKTLFHADK